MYKKLDTETDDEHYIRVRNMLLSIDEKRFSNIANLIDPTDDR